MRIEADSVLPFSRDAVFKAYRDDLPKVVEFLPNVREIECKKREEAGPVTTLFNVWHGGGATISCNVAPVVSSPCSTAQLIGTRPRYFGSREPCILNAPCDANANRCTGSMCR